MYVYATIVCSYNIVGTAISGCSNVGGSLFLLRALQKGKFVDHVCLAKVKCKDVPGSLINITCEKGYKVNVLKALDQCQVCEGKYECWMFVGNVHCLAFLSFVDVVMYNHCMLSFVCS